MTRSDFYLIAAVIRESTIGDASRWRIAQEFCLALKGSNPRFDPEWFLAACGGPPDLVKRSGE